jgi:hypothetical protein
MLTEDAAGQSKWRFVQEARCGLLCRHFMSSKLAPPPPVASETMRALLAATAEFAALKPWESMYNRHVVGLTDPVTGEIRLGSVLGNGGEVFGAAFYRRPAGLRWILGLLDSPNESMSLEALEGMDALKVELIPKRQMLKEDLDTLNVLNFRPSGRGCVWPQFQSAQPGWLPWFIDQTEAEQLLADLPRLTSFSALFHNQSTLFDDRAPAEIPFLPDPMPSRPLQVEDLDWRLLVASPEPCDRFQATDEQLAQLRSLHRVPTAAYEYGCSLMPGHAVLEKGRRCYSRIGLLVEHRRGLVLGFDVSLGTASLVESAGVGLVKTLLQNGLLPGKILVSGNRLERILEPLCAVLHIEITLSDPLPALAAAMASVGEFMRVGPR